MGKGRCAQLAYDSNPLFNWTISDPFNGLENRFREGAIAIVGGNVPGIPIFSFVFEGEQLVAWSVEDGSIVDFIEDGLNVSGGGIDEETEVGVFKSIVRRFLEGVGAFLDFGFWILDLGCWGVGVLGCWGVGVGGRLVGLASRGCSRWVGWVGG